MSIPTEENVSAQKITKDELIRAELKGKNEAIGRYDTILWRIRSGYVIVIYGSVLLFTGKEGSIVSLLAKETLVWIVIANVFVLSIILAGMDFGFRLRQLRVVSAYNQLSDIAFTRAAGGQESQDDELRCLLHIAGESKSDRLKRFRAVVLISTLYLVTPFLAFTAFFIFRMHVGNGFP